MHIVIRRLIMVSLIAASNQAGAVLMSVDWQSQGDNLVTRDTDTGLEWLDLTLTVGNSLAETEAESFFDAAESQGRFRWATNSEIVALMNVITWISHPTSANEVGVHHPSAQQMQETAAWTSMIGRTYQSSSEYFSRGISRSVEPTSGDYGMGFVYWFDIGGGNNIVSQNPLRDCCSVANEDRPTTGAWLVRSSQVPEPTTLALFGLGMAGLGFGRRKVKAKAKL